MIAALVSADFVLSPIQLNQEAVDGVRALLTHSRVGVYKIEALLNPKLELIGLLPTMVEATPFQRANFRQLIERYLSLMIRIGAERVNWHRSRSVPPPDRPVRIVIPFPPRGRGMRPRG